MNLLEKSYKFKCEDEMVAKVKVEELRKTYAIKDYKIRNVEKKDEFYTILNIKLLINNENEV